MKKAGNETRLTIKVDVATLLASRVKFARVCVEVDLEKPLMVGYQMHGEFWRQQYEGLHDLCFGCGRYGHMDATCLLKDAGAEGDRKDAGQVTTSDKPKRMETQNEEHPTSGYDDWMVVQ